MRSDFMRVYLGAVKDDGLQFSDEMSSDPQVQPAPAEMSGDNHHYTTRS